MYNESEGLVVEKRGNSRAIGTRAEAQRSVWQPGKSVVTHFAEGLVGNFHLQKPRTWVDFVVSVFGHSLVVTVLILLPLYFTGDHQSAAIREDPAGDVRLRPLPWFTKGPTASEAKCRHPPDPASPAGISAACEALTA